MKSVMVDSHGLYCSDSRTEHYRIFVSPDSCSVSDMKKVFKLIPVEKKIRLVKKKIKKLNTHTHNLPQPKKKKKNKTKKQGKQQSFIEW